MDTPIIDHRGPEFAKLAKRALDGIKTIFKTTNPVIIYTATGTGAWEGALVNTLSPGDRVLMVETGQFATLWKKMAEQARPQAGIHRDRLAQRRRPEGDRSASCARTRSTRSRRSACCTTRPRPAALSPIAEIRKAIDAAGHPALFMVDTISSLASADYRHDEWGVDVTVGGAQKGLMLPPGMSFNAVSDKALAASEDLEAAEVVLGLGRHARHEQDRLLPLHAGDADAARPRRRRSRCCTRKASTTCSRATTASPRRRAAPCKAWGLENPARERRASYSPTITAVLLPEGHDADAFRALALDTFNISYGASFGPYAGKYFRIGHLGDINDGTLIGALGITEMALALAGIPHKKGGVQAAMDYLVSAHAGRSAPRRSSARSRDRSVVMAGLVPAVRVCSVMQQARRPATMRAHGEDDACDVVSGACGCVADAHCARGPRAELSQPPDPR